MACIDNSSRYFALDYDKTFNLISATEIEVPIGNGRHKYFIDEQSLPMFKKIYNSKVDEIVSFITNKEIRDRIKEKICLSVIPDYKNDCLFIGFSPRRIVSDLFKELHINPNNHLDGEKLDITYSNPIDYDYQRTLVLNVLQKAYVFGTSLRTTYEVNLEKAKGPEFDEIYKAIRGLDKQLTLIHDFMTNLDKIFELINDRTIADAFRSEDIKVSYENLANLIAVQSLSYYNSDKNIIRKNNYIYYPYKFYEKCTKPTARGLRLPGVNPLIVNGIEYDDMFFRFNNELENAVKNNEYLIDLLLGFRDNKKFTIYETIGPKNIVFDAKEFGEYIAYKKNKECSGGEPKTIDEQKERLIREKQFNSKVKFYSYGADFSKHIVSRMYINAQDGTGYIGFILDNDHIVIDKFFEIRKPTDDFMVPAINSAVIAVPLDIYMELDGDLKRLREYVIKNQDNNKHLLHKYHTTDSYQDSVLELANLESISSINAINFTIYNGGKIDPTSPYIKLKKHNTEKKTEKIDN